MKISSVQNILSAFVATAAVLGTSAQEAIPLTIKYQTVGQDGTCQPQDASNIFIRRPGLPGCNPTFNGNPDGYQSWTVMCSSNDMGNTYFWDINWYNDTISCAGDIVDTDVIQPSCDTNDKGETEAFLCSPEYIASDVFGERHRFTLRLDLFRDDQGSEEGLFMIQYIIPFQCIVQSPTFSQMFEPDSINDVGVLREFDNGDCSGAGSRSEVPVGAVFAYSTNEAGDQILAWARIASFDADPAEFLPTSRPTTMPTGAPTLYPTRMPTTDVPTKVTTATQPPVTASPTQAPTSGSIRYAIGSGLKSMAFAVIVLAAPLWASVF